MHNSFHARVIAARLGADGIVTQLRGSVDGPYPIGDVSVWVTEEDAESARVGESLYEQLTGAGIEVIIDDRAERAGVKFRDAEITGIPFRVTVGKRGLAVGTAELTDRATGSTVHVALADLAQHVREAIAKSIAGHR